MSLSNEQILKYNSRLLFSRLRILQNNGFYGMLLMHVKFKLDDSCETAYTDGTSIAFSPKFLDCLKDNELDFVLMHEIMHIVLRHCYRGLDKDQNLFNIACDIVVNSNILYSNDMDINTITLTKYGESMHITPREDEGYLYTAEEVYEMLINKRNSLDNNSNNKTDKKRKNNSKNNASNNLDNSFDDHSKWDKEIKDKEQDEEWLQRIINAVKTIEKRVSPRKSGNIPLGATRLVKELMEPTLDWRLILAEFIDEEICDYSFNPPDKRYGDSSFYLPDFNDLDTFVKDILFMVDTSGSISDDDLVRVYSEISGAIQQFDGKLTASIGFFDFIVYKPVPFDSVNDLLKIKPYGGGGTNFKIIFDYIFENMTDNLPATIIILTDGLAEFPKEEVSRNIPVLWILNNNKVKIPWGRVAILK